MDPRTGIIIYTVILIVYYYLQAKCIMPILSRFTSIPASIYIYVMIDPVCVRRLM